MAEKPYFSFTIVTTELMHLTSVKVYISFRPRDNWTNENINFANFIFASVTEKNFYFFNSRIRGGSGKKTRVS